MYVDPVPITYTDRSLGKQTLPRKCSEWRLGE
jgi:hypothetical protein